MNLLQLLFVLLHISLSFTDCVKNPSFPRMFNLINSDKLDDKDIKDFFDDIFQKSGITFKDEKYL